MNHGRNGTNPHRFLVPVTYSNGVTPHGRGALLRTFSRMPAYVPGCTRVVFVPGPDQRNPGEDEDANSEWERWSARRLR